VEYFTVFGFAFSSNSQFQKSQKKSKLSLLASVDSLQSKLTEHSFVFLHIRVFHISSLFFQTVPCNVIFAFGGRLNSLALSIKLFFRVIFFSHKYIQFLFIFNHIL
jgi:hypothetical protein